MTASAPDVLLLTAPGCPHCPGMKQSFNRLLEQGEIGKLELVDITEHPEIANELQVRSVPWFRIGPFELQGLHSQTELKQWITRARDENGLAVYLDELLSSGQLGTVEKFIRRHPEHLQTIIQLIADPDIGVSTRIGIGALLEGLEGSGLAKPLVPGLAALLDTEDTRMRTDVVHYLGLTENREAIPYLEKCLHDADADVREVAAEGLEILNKG